MKSLIVILTLLTGCSAIAADTSKPPTGEEVFDAIFSSTKIDLSQEPLCNTGSATRNKNTITLGEHISTILSLSYENENLVSIKSSCELSKTEPSKGKIVDAWDCKLQINESNTDGEFISSATIAFDLSIDKEAILKKTLRCL